MSAITLQAKKTNCPYGTQKTRQITPKGVCHLSVYTGRSRLKDPSEISGVAKEIAGSISACHSLETIVRIHIKERKPDVMVTSRPGRDPV